MIDFEEAVSAALRDVTKLVKSAKNPIVEEAVIDSSKKTYEITLSYDLDRGDFSKDNLNFNNESLRTLAELMGRRREYKVFLIDAKTGELRGFRKYKER